MDKNIMNDLKKDLFANIKYLKTEGSIIDYSKENIYNQLFATSKYEYKTLTKIKDIISILGIAPELKKYITSDLYKYFDDYISEVYK